MKRIFEFFQNQKLVVTLIFTSCINSSLCKTLQSLEVAIFTCCHHWSLPLQVLHSQTGPQLQQLGDDCLVV